jgi:Txe/YoeB family toxin of Txe-Axe toxin-antitoxin module
MSILEKPQIIHIIAEAVVFIGITLYFTQKNKKLMNHINDLMQRLEDQEDIIQKHEQMIVKLSNIVSEMCQQPPSFINIIKQDHPTNTVSSSMVEELPIKTSISNSILQNKVQQKSKNNKHNRNIIPESSKIEELNEEIAEDSNSEEQEDDENYLDNELLEELKDLEE